MALDLGALAAMRGGGGQVAQMVPRDILEAQMQHQETITNVNISFSIANSETIFKHACDGSEEAKKIITGALHVLVAYLKDVRVNGQEIFPNQEEAPPDESGVDAAAT